MKDTPSPSCSRRNLWAALLQEYLVLRGALAGEPGYRLSDLAHLQDSELAQITPVVNPDFQIFVDQGHVCGRSRKTQTTQQLFQTTHENLTAFNLFNGRNHLGDIGSRVAAELGWDEGEGFAHVRQLFLSLASSRVCLPSAPPEAGE